MATILRFTRAEDPYPGKKLRNTRREFGLSLAQAAKALGVSAATIENWERSGNPRLSTDDVSKSYSNFGHAADRDVGNNLLFGSYPLRLARQLLQVSPDEMATQFGYSKAAWLKLEANARPLPDTKLFEIEERIRSKLAQICC
jgi:DNA-binding XRE family transcriptional regulator